MRGLLGKTRGQRIFNGAILLFVAVAVYISFKPYIETPAFRIDEVREMDRRIVIVSADNVVEMLKGNDRPVMLVVYASWCPICQQVMPVVTQLMRDGKLGKVIPVFVSVDSEPRELSRYLIYQDYHQLYAPYMLEWSLFNVLPATLQTTGSQFNGAIPYVGFFDAEGKMLLDNTGLVDQKTLLEQVNKITK